MAHVSVRQYLSMCVCTFIIKCFPPTCDTDEDVVSNHVSLNINHQYLGT